MRQQHKSFSIEIHQKQQKKGFLDKFIPVLPTLIFFNEKHIYPNETQGP